MADSYRLLVLKRLTVLLEGTMPTPYAGIAFPASLEGVVFRGRAVYGTDDPDTMLSILESPRANGAIYAGEGEARKDLWPLLLQGWAPDDKKNPYDPIYGLLDDVELRLDRVTRVLGSNGDAKYLEHYMLGVGLNGSGTLISEFRVGQPVVRPPTQGISSKTFFYIPLQVGLARISP